MEKASPDLCYLEHLAVLPRQRRRGLGRALVAYVLTEARCAGLHRVSIGIIAEHVELKAWYHDIGFNEGETKDFAHLPFRVTFMELNIGGQP
jgi:ribosomal protein S18 acetylase RimI-like enzyme